MYLTLILNLSQLSLVTVPLSSPVAYLSFAPYGGKLFFVINQFSIILNSVVVHMFSFNLWKI